MKQLIYILASIVTFSFASCAASKSTTTISKGFSLSKYKYVVFGTENNGDAELDDIIMMVQNELSEKLTVVSSSKANKLIEQGEYVLTPKINVKTEKWDGGHTYITINLYDFYTNQSIAIVKSSGIGLTISHDQKLAFNAIKKELNKVFAPNK